MNINSILILLCLVMIVFLFFTMDDAQAQSGDQRLAQQDGLGQKEFDRDKLPGKLEYAIVIGSIIAAIGVIKYA